MIHRFYGNNYNFANRQGGVQILNNGHYLVCWANNTNYQYSELNSKGETIQKRFYKAVNNYRLNKGEWRPKLLVLRKDKKMLVV